MYSIILLASLSSPTDIPQGILFDRGTGCTGAFGSPVRTWLAGRREALADRIHARRTAVTAGAGCAGTMAPAKTVTTVTTTKTTVPAGYTRLPATVPAPVAAVPPAMEGPFRRAAARAQLRRALESADLAKLTAGQKASLARTLADPDIFEALAAKTHRDLAAQVRASGAVGAIGDGSLLKLLLANLPAILDAAERIIKWFS